MTITKSSRSDEGDKTNTDPGAEKAGVKRRAVKTHRLKLIYFDTDAAIWNTAEVLDSLINESADAFQKFDARLTKMLRDTF